MKIKQFIKHQIHEQTDHDKEHLLSLEHKILTQLDMTKVLHKHTRTHRFTPMYMTRFAVVSMVAIVIFFAGMTILPQSNNPILKKMQNKVGIQQVSAAELIKAVQEAMNVERLHYFEKQVAADGAYNTTIQETWVDKKSKKVKRILRREDGSLQHVDVGDYSSADVNAKSYVFAHDFNTKEGIYIESSSLPAIESLIENDFIEAMDKGYIENATVDTSEYNSRPMYKLTLRNPEGNIWRKMLIDAETRLPVFSEVYGEDGNPLGTTNYEFVTDKFTDEVFEPVIAPEGYTIMENAKITQFSLFPNSKDTALDGTVSFKYGYQIQVSNGTSTVTLSDGFPAGYTQKLYVSIDGYGTVEKAAEATDIVWEPLVYEKPSYLLPYFHTTQNETDAYARFKLTVLNTSGTIVYELDRVAPLAELTSEEKFNGPQNLPEYFTYFTPVESR